jgi:C4-dicarboxylate-specific signal transduction histidine kinase
VIDAATKRAATIVRDLMLFAEHLPLHPSRCQVADEIEQVLALQRARLDAERVEVRTEFEPAPDIWADTSQLQEAFLHLVQNAAQAMVAAHGRGTLTIRVKPSARGVRIEVADDGPGVPSDDLPRIFTPFFTTKSPGEGRGLGLSVAYSIIAEHEGVIRADNLPEGGAIFVIDLPIGAPSVQLTS